MGTLVDLDDYRPHRVGAAYCVACDRTWIAVAPAGTDVLQCPRCREMTGLFGAPDAENQPGEGA